MAEPKTLRQWVQEAFDTYHTTEWHEFEEALALPDQLQTAREPSEMLFEAWFGRSFPDDHLFAKRSDGLYSDSAVRCAWAGFQAGYKTALTTPESDSSSLRAATTGDEL